MLVRKAKSTEELALALNLAKRFHAESIFKHRKFSEEKVIGLMLSYNEDTTGDLFLRLAFDDSGNVLGGIMAYMTAPYFSEDRVAYDNGIFIDAGSRGSRAALMLLDAYVEWAWDNGAEEVWFGETAGIAREAFAKLMAHTKFDNQGSFYRRIL